MTAQMRKALRLSVPTERLPAAYESLLRRLRLKRLLPRPRRQSRAPKQSKPTVR